MNNSIRYHFSDFTFENYRRLLRIARQKYVFCSFDDITVDNNILIWRHDVDYSMHAALNFAKIENEEGISSTYFVYLHSELYNLLESEITQLVNEILSLDHKLGIHFNCDFYNINNEEELEYYLNFEKYLLEHIFKHSIKVFSFHNPTPVILEFNKLRYAGLINTYGEFFQKEMTYCSDSNGYWRHRRLEDVLSKGNDNKLQVLTHPEWWHFQILSPKQRIYRCIDGRAKNNKDWYDKSLKEDGRENIDWDI